MSEQADRMALVKRFIKMARRERCFTLNETELAEYEALGRELAMINGDELLRLLSAPDHVGSVIYTLRS